MPHEPRCSAEPDRERGPGRERGVAALARPSPTMSQGSPGAWAPLDPTSGSSASPNPFVHELHLSGLQRVKVRCGQGTCGRLVGMERPSDEMGKGVPEEVDEKLVGRELGGAHVGAAGGG